MKSQQPFCLTTLFFCLVWCVCFSRAEAQTSYQKAWQALEQADLATARKHLTAALQDPQTAADAGLSYALVETIEGREGEARPYVVQSLKGNSNPYPYYYALWANAAFGGDHMKRSTAKEKAMEALVEDEAAPASLRASARYQLFFQYLVTREFKKARAIVEPISNVTSWQFTGPFDNVSQSGFDKNYPPIANPAPTARFQALNNAEIQWFAPYEDQRHKHWTIVGEYIKWNTGIAYAQSFVQSPVAQDVTLAVGFTGSCKVWVNDQLLIAEPEERQTDFDLYQVPCRLQAGHNRVLVQISLDKELPANFCVRFLDKQGALVPNLTSSTQYAPYPKQEGPLPAVKPFLRSSIFKKKYAKSQTTY